MSPNANGPAPQQRLRITFGVGGGARYAGHMDLTRAWIRALRRLGAPLAYSKGYNPHPRLSVAAPLPLGFVGERELLDLYLDAPVDLVDLARRLRIELPAGLSLHTVEPIAMEEPPLPSRVEAADYVITFYVPPPHLEEQLQHLLLAESLPFTRVRRDKEIRFDLRPRILRAEVTEANGQPALALRLAHGPRGAARPQDVIAAMGLDWPNARARRIGLVLAP